MEVDSVSRQYQELLAKNFEKSMKYKGFSLDYLEDANLFNDYIMTFKDATLPDINKLEFMNIGQQAVFAYTFQHLHSIAPSVFTFPAFKYIMDITIEYDGDSPMDGWYTSIIHKNNIEEHIIQIPSDFGDALFRT